MAKIPVKITSPESPEVNANADIAVSGGPLLNVTSLAAWIHDSGGKTIAYLDKPTTDPPNWSFTFPNALPQCVTGFGGKCNYIIFVQATNSGGDIGLDSKAIYVLEG